jgi:plasmid stabilization system protein ParE
VKLAWSNRAIAELRELRRSSVERWGPGVALRYLEDLRAAANHLADDPRRARPLKPPFHVLRVRSHYLTVHIDVAAGRLTIARVLHAARNIERHLP